MLTSLYAIIAILKSLLFGDFGSLSDWYRQRSLLLVSHLVQKHKNNCSRCSQMLGRGGRRSGGYAN